MFICFFIATLSDASYSAEDNPARYEDDDIQIRLVIRTPEQLAAFYIGRGFHQQAISKIETTCFITVLIKNKNIDVLWLELDNWLFSASDNPITRLDRNYWKKQWQEVELPLNHQSTFGWTLLPEIRDLRLYEGVGGNVVIPRQDNPFDMEIAFKTGADKTGKEKRGVFHQVKCGANK